MRKNTKKILLNVVLVVGILFGASYLNKFITQREIEIEGTKVNLISLDSYTFTKVDSKVTFYHEDYKNLIWGFNYDSQPVLSTLGFMTVEKETNSIRLGLNSVYYVPLQLVATDLAGTYSKTIDLYVNLVEGITITETEVVL